ncbi:MAG: hypothetical protein ACOH5I_13005 [Oligoflexus sp.]
MFKFLPCILILGGILSACGDDDEAQDNSGVLSGVVVSDGVLSVETILPAFLANKTNVDEIPATQFHNTFYSSYGGRFNSFFYDYGQDTSSTDAEVELDCMDRADLDATVISTNAKMITLSQSVSTSDACIAEIKAELAESDYGGFSRGSEYSSVSYLHCTGDVAEFNGLQIESYADFSPLLEACGDMIGFSSYSKGVGIRFSVTRENDAVVGAEHIFYEFENFEMAKDGSSCTFQKEGNTYTAENDCLSGSYKHSEHEEFELEEQFFYGEHKDRVAIKGPYDWYESGTVDVTACNWSGTVTFQGKETYPTYNMSNGTEQLTGNLSSGFQSPLYQNELSNVRSMKQALRSSFK